MPKQIYSIDTFHRGVVTSQSGADQDSDSSIYMKNVDPMSVIGTMQGIEGDETTPHVFTTYGYPVLFGDTTVGYACALLASGEKPSIVTDCCWTPSTTTDSSYSGIDCITVQNGIAMYGEYNGDSRIWVRHQHKRNGSSYPASPGFYDAALDRPQTDTTYVKVCTNCDYTATHGIAAKYGGTSLVYLDLNDGEEEQDSLDDDVTFKSIISICDKLSLTGNSTTVYVLDDDGPNGIIYEVAYSAGVFSISNKWPIRGFGASTASYDHIRVSGSILTDICHGGGDNIYVSIFTPTEISKADSAANAPAMLYYVDKSSLSNGDQIELVEVLLDTYTSLWGNANTKFTTFRRNMAPICDNTDKGIMMVTGINGVDYTGGFNDAYVCGFIVIDSYSKSSRNNRCLCTIGEPSPDGGGVNISSVYSIQNIGSGPDHSGTGGTFVITGSGVDGEGHYLAFYDFWNGSSDTYGTVTAGNCFTLSKKASQSNLLSDNNNPLCIPANGSSGNIVVFSAGFSSWMRLYDAEYATYVVDNPSTVSGFGPVETLGAVMNVSKESSLDSRTVYRYKITYEYDGIHDSPLSSSYLEINPVDQVVYNGSGTVSVETSAISVNALVPSTISDRVSAIKIWRASGDGAIGGDQFSSYRLLSRVGLEDRQVERTINAATYYSIKVLDTGNIGPTFEEETGLYETQEVCTPNWGIAGSGGGYHCVGFCSDVPDLKTAVHYVFISEPLAPLQFNFGRKFAKLKEKAVCIKYWNGLFYVFTDNYLYRIDPQTAAVQDEIHGLGVEGQNSAFANDYGIFVAGKNNIYLDVGNGLQPVGNAIKKSLNGIGWDDRYATPTNPPEAFFLEDKNCFCVWYEDTASTAKVWMYRVDTEAWFLQETSATDGHIVLDMDGNARSSSKRLYTDTTRRSFNYTSPILSFPHEEMDSKVYEVRTAYRTTAPTSVTIDVDGVPATTSPVTDTGSIGLHSEVLNSTNRRGRVFTVNVAGNTTTVIEGIGIVYRTIGER